MLVVSCIPSSTVSASTSPCADIAGMHYVPVVVEVFIPSQSQIEVLTAGVNPPDAAALSSSFAVAFSAVMFCWLLGRSLGVVLESIRR